MRYVGHASLKADVLDEGMDHFQFLKTERVLETAEAKGEILREQ